MSAGEKKGKKMKKNNDFKKKHIASVIKVVSRCTQLAKQGGKATQ